MFDPDTYDRLVDEEDAEVVIKSITKKNKKTRDRISNATIRAILGNDYDEEDTNEN